MIDENRAEGFARTAGGKLQDAVGGLTGDASTQMRGKVNQAAGQAQNIYRQVADRVKNFASERPIGALLAAGGVGVMLGLLLARR